MTEIWKPVVGNPHYEVSSLGQVRSKRGLLEPFPHGNNRYLMVSLARFNGTGFKQVTVHKLVLEAFVGEQPSENHRGHHKNGVKTDNSAANLEWLDFRAHGRAHMKLDEAARFDIALRYESRKTTMRALAREYGVGIATIHRIVHRRVK